MTPIIDSPALAHRIRKARKQRKLSQQALARMAGIEQSQVSRLEGGKVSQPTIQDVACLAAGLRIPIDAFISMEEKDFEALLISTSQPNESTKSESLDDLRTQLAKAFGGGIGGQQVITDIDHWIESGGYVLIQGENEEEVVNFSNLCLCLDSMNSAKVCSSFSLKLLEGQSSLGSLEKLKSSPGSFAQPLIVDAVGFLELGMPPIIRTGGLVLDPGVSLENASSFPSSALLRKLCESGIIRIHIDEDLAPQYIEQLLYARGGSLAVLPLYESTDGELVQVNDVIQADNYRNTSYRVGSLPRGVHPVSESTIPLGSVYTDAGQIEIGGEYGMLSHNMLITGPSEARGTVLAQLACGAAREPGAVFLFSQEHNTTYTAAELIIKDAKRVEDLMIIPLSNQESTLTYNPLVVQNRGEICEVVEMLYGWMISVLGLRRENCPEALEYARYAIWAMCEANLHGLSGKEDMQLTLLHIPLFFSDKDFRHTVMEFCVELSAREVFDQEGAFESLGDKKQAEVIAPVLRALRAAFSREHFSHIFGPLDPRPVRMHGLTRARLQKIVTQGKIVIIGAEHPGRGADSLGGSLAYQSLVSMLGYQIASIMRSKHSEETPCTILLDDAAGVFGEHLHAMMKPYGPGRTQVVLSSPSPDDFSPEQLSFIRRNVQSVMSGRLDPISAKHIAEIIASGTGKPQVADLSNCKENAVWANIRSEDGSPSGPFCFTSPSLFSYFLDPEEDKKVLELMVKAERRPTTKTLRTVKNCLQGNIPQSANTIMHTLVGKIRDRNAAIEPIGIGEAGNEWDSANWDWNEG